MALIFEADASGSVTFCDRATSGPGTGAVRIVIQNHAEPHVAAAAVGNALEAHREVVAGQADIARNSHLRGMSDTRSSGGQVNIYIARGVDPGVASSALMQALEAHREAHAGNWSLTRNAHLKVVP